MKTIYQITITFFVYKKNNGKLNEPIITMINIIVLINPISINY